MADNRLSSMMRECSRDRPGAPSKPPAARATAPQAAPGLAAGRFPYGNLPHPSPFPPRTRALMSTDYLKRILTSKVYDVAVESPLEPAPLLSQRLSTVLLKREDTQAVFSFKLRGAYNKMANLPPAARNRGVIAASAGNHAQGVALAATRLGCRAVIVMPTTSPQVKVDAVRRLGGEVVLAGEVSPMPTPTRRCWKEGKADLRASVRRSRRDRRPGYGGNGDPAPASGSDRRHLRGHRRRRADLGRGRLHQAAAPRSRSSACRPRTPTPCCAACARAGACS